jgi:hypothetical protein
MSLYRGDELVLDSLHVVYPASMYVDESGRGDFAMLVEQSGTARPLLVQNNRLETYEQLTYHFTLPVYAGERLITVESDPVTYNRLIVRQDGEPIFTYLTTGFEVGMPVKGLHAWNGSWVLEVNGTLIVDGVNWNQKELAADEIFGFQMLDGQPFFFFVRDGVTGLWYAGEELPVRYAEVIHYRCCEPAMFNQGGNERMVWFYARRDGMWYYTELGKFE